jgi:tetratricopeptide (TPR) repeat protein
VTVSDPVTETWPLKERRALARIAGPRRFEERIREETRDLPDRDYEILAKMATGIRPILDRLDEIEGRIAEMEEGEEPLPADPRGWLNAELADTIAGAAGARRLPRSIEEAVAKRFQSMAGKLQEEIEQQHVRALETFVGNIQLKLVRRVSALEQNMRQQTEAMHELREYNQRTDDNLNRLISGVDKLAKRLVRRAEPAEPEVQRTGKGSRVPITPGRSSLKPGIFWSVVAVVIVLAGVYKFHSPRKAISPAAEKQGQTASGAAGVSLFGADIKTKLEAAGQDKDRKEYRSAEEVYKQVLRAEPGNEDALTGLASVLYREDKLEESAAVLERLPKN